MKKELFAALAAIALTIGTAADAQAKSRLAELSVTFTPMPFSASVSSGTTVHNYQLTIVREGQGLLDVTFAAADMPQGAVVSFTPAKLRFTGRNPEVQTTIMTVVCPGDIDLANYPFSIVASAQRESLTFRKPASEFPLTPAVTVEPQPDGTCWVRGFGGLGQTYVIEAAVDQSDPYWVPVGLATADNYGRFSFWFKDTTSTRPFFRAFWVDPVLLETP